jgi:hypothetical protein
MAAGGMELQTHGTKSIRKIKKMMGKVDALNYMTCEDKKRRNYLSIRLHVEWMTEASLCRPNKFLM